VFEYLRSRLQDFTYANWTSEMREFAEYPAFDGVSHADFQYHDSQGILTGELFPDTPSFLGATPEYFIEVKSTSGAQGDHFFMRESQFLHVGSDCTLSGRH
jgi:hypothetical protein